MRNARARPHALAVLASLALLAGCGSHSGSHEHRAATRASEDAATVESDAAAVHGEMDAGSRPRMTATDAGHPAHLDASAIAKDAGTAAARDAGAVHDAAPAPDAAAGSTCGRIRPWPSPPGAWGIAPVRDHDGFFAIMDTKDAKGDRISVTGLFGPAGELLHTITNGGEPSFDPSCMGCLQPVAPRAVARGETIVGIVYVPAPAAPPKTDQVLLVMASEQSVQQTLVGFYYTEARVYLALRSDKKVLLAEHGGHYSNDPPNSTVSTIDLHTRALDGSNDIETTTDTLGYAIVDLVVDANDRAYALQQPADEQGGPTAPNSRAVALDANGKLGASYTTSNGVWLYAIAVDRMRGKLAVAGASDLAKPQTFVQLLDPSTMKPVWSTPATTAGIGRATAIDFAPNGDLMIGGDGGLMRLNRSDGSPLWSKPAEGMTNISALHVQSDDTVLGMGWDKNAPNPHEQGFVFCE